MTPAELNKKHNVFFKVYLFTITFTVMTKDRIEDSMGELDDSRGRYTQAYRSGLRIARVAAPSEAWAKTWLETRTGDHALEISNIDAAVISGLVSPGGIENFYLPDEAPQ